MGDGLFGFDCKFKQRFITAKFLSRRFTIFNLFLQRKVASGVTNRRFNRFSIRHSFMNTRVFNTRVVTLRPRLMARCHSVGLSEEEGEDLVQETFLRLWQMRADLKRYKSIEALALTILQRLQIDLFRKRERQRRFLQTHSEEQSAQAVFPLGETAEAIENIIDDLPYVQQTVFRMREIEGYSTRELVLITGLTETNLRQILSRARRKIREQWLLKYNR